jgi:lipopolysaccharide transport system permease protein
LYNIALREIKVRYKQTLVGAAWAVIQPLSLMLLFTVIFSHFVHMPSDGIPYPIFSFSALLPWTFFSTALSFSVSSLVGNANLITKVYFPREIFPLASVLSAAIDYGIGMAVFIGMMILYRVPFTVTFLYLFPLLIVQIIFTIAIALFFAALNVYYRDVRNALPLIIQLWMFASPIIYPISVVPDSYRAFYLLNPMAVLIDGYRKAILQGTTPSLPYLVVAAVVTGLLLCLSYRSLM